MTLYELTQEAAYLQDMFDGGEIDEQVLKDTLESLCVPEKFEDACKVIRNLEAEKAACKAEKDRFAAKEKAADKGIELLKRRMCEYMNAVNKKNVDAGLFKVSRRAAAPALRILDESKIPESYFEPQPPKLDNARLKTALKNGETVSGCELKASNYVVIK